jgi:hypothetical protein
MMAVAMLAGVVGFVIDPEVTRFGYLGAILFVFSSAVVGYILGDIAESLHK